MTGAVLALLAASAAGPVGPFALTAPDGSVLRLDPAKARVTVIVFLSAECPISNAYNDRMSALYRDYPAKSVQFAFVNSNQNEPASQVASHSKVAGFPFPVLRDPGNGLADRLGAQVTPEVFVVLPSGAVAYHGPMDDHQNEARVRIRAARDAIDAVLAAKAPERAELKAFGCTIKRTRRGSQLTPVDQTGYGRLLAGARGQVVLVNFWATWCGSCRKEMPGLAQLEARLKPRGLVMVTVSTDETEQEPQALQFLRQHRVPMPAYIAIAEVPDQFITMVDPKWNGALPALFLYDRSGRKRKAWVGETEIAEIEAEIRKLL